MLGLGVDLTTVATVLYRAPVEEPGGLVNLIDNGTFDDDSAWILSDLDALSITGGKLVFADAGEATQDTNAPITESLFYQADLVVSDYAAGEIRASIGAGALGALRTADGSFSEFLRAGATQTFALTSQTGASFTVDDVIVTGPIATPLNTELCPDPGFDDAGAWTIGGASLSVTGGALVATGSIGNRSATCAPDGYPLNAGTYEVIFTLVARAAGTARVEICGILSTGRTVPGTYTEQIVVAEANTGTQTILVRMITSPNMTVDNLSVKKVA